MRARSPTAGITRPTSASGADDLLCILAFAGIDLATVDLAAIHNGAVVVPIQTNAPIQQLVSIFEEVEPRWLATSLDLSRSCTYAELGGDSLSALSCSILLEEIYEIEVPASVINNPAARQVSRR